MFVCETDENRSASFHLRDGINGGRIPKNWVLLDSQSTADAYSNPDLLTDIHEVKGSLTIHTQAGKAVTTLRGTVPGYGEVWFCPNGIANILSLANVAKTEVPKITKALPVIKWTEGFKDYLHRVIPWLMSFALMALCL